jgi:preprotein translocase subunit SecE
MKKIARFLVSVKKEMKKVKWPTKKDMVTYSTASLSIIIVIALYFTVIDLVISFLEGII